MKAKYLIKGIIKSIPGIEYLYEFNKTTGGTCSARYCYSVWLRHLIFAYRNGFSSVPKVVAELGPGDTLGTGLAALISGAEKYYALDVKMYSNLKQNLKIFDELLLLFKKRTNVPDQTEFPRLRPLLENYLFPEDIFTNDFLNEILNEKRISNIRNSLRSIDGPNAHPKNEFIEFKIPWNVGEAIEEKSVDLVFSQAVLQAVDDLENTYEKIAQWLKPDGLQSHDIGFKSCATADEWDGHWEYSDTEWKIIRGRKKFSINREPYSTHLRLLKKTNFQIIVEKKDFAKSNVNREKLPHRFRNISTDDLTTFSVFFQAAKTK